MIWGRGGLHPDSNCNNTVLLSTLQTQSSKEPRQFSGMASEGNPVVDTEKEIEVSIPGENKRLDTREDGEVL